MTEPITRAMLLAAGQGTRLRPLTDHQPKPMLPVGGRPLIEHTVLQLARYGVREISINLHHRPEVVEQYFGNGSRYGLHIEYSFEPQLLGTAGAVKKLESLFRGAPFFLIYGDNLTTCHLDRLVSLHRAKAGIATIALFWKDDVSPHSAVELQLDARITRFVEKPKPEEAPSHWISAGVNVLEPQVLDRIPVNRPSDFGYDIFPLLAAQGEKLYGYCMSQEEGLWWIDTPEHYWRICDLWKGGFPTQ